MVSFWPWKGSEDAASFERTLNALTGKINRAAARNDKQKQLARRARVMWTLYAGFAYILIAVVLTFVTGWQNWGPIEGSVVAGGPLLYVPPLEPLTRHIWLTTVPQHLRSTLEKLDKERDATIERLKEATKYNSTQQLLEKYGGASPKPKESVQDEDDSPARSRSRGPQKPLPPPGPRTGIAPPPTANIHRPQPPQLPTTPQQVPSIVTPPPPPSLPPLNAPGAEFASNAFESHLNKQQQQQEPAIQPPTVPETHWYDRILDALLGEDETQAKNRFALICTECRLVNGQAPPGARTLEDVGRWRCGGCSAWNGKEKVREDDVTRLVKGWEAERRAKSEAHLRTQSPDGGIDSDNRETEDDGIMIGADEGLGVHVPTESTEDDDAPRARVTRSKSRGKARK